MSRLPRVLFVMCLVQLQFLASSFTRMEAPNVPGSKVHVPTCTLRRVTCPLGGNKSVAPCTTLSWGGLCLGVLLQAAMRSSTEENNLHLIYSDRYVIVTIRDDLDGPQFCNAMARIFGWSGLFCAVYDEVTSLPDFFVW
ncbi:hypothetical protein M431DRAFT_481706 [Trichoderma harzianum CBS 226.95]|uniref:Receptor ligand binding region domain-containing protein n=1 Tax=Trichoderma harzianum CBS 226.95 TaxID=983964 RepID=A0A2T4ABU1_TRIHA|nr:hypothetical protein M431DRAFT_481706 [Trichoderma harzianum CBS 226.95]PTB54473.1 hypothetical protein M431DRAFT_481706 [Trichoderma harzianum CBS 226.95]